ncbi:hypothetical protein TNCV_2130761 [Trichonephila clavipes]|nr:hypothetical protein TNCV_2130761 [Trichonephila clavipes]
MPFGVLPLRRLNHLQSVGPVRQNHICTSRVRVYSATVQPALCQCDGNKAAFRRTPSYRFGIPSGGLDSSSRR